MFADIPAILEVHSWPSALTAAGYNCPKPGPELSVTATPSHELASDASGPGAQFSPRSLVAPGAVRGKQFGPALTNSPRPQPPLRPRARPGSRRRGSAWHLRSLPAITNRCHAGDNVEMDAGEQLAAEILDAITSGRDLWVFDQFIEGPDRLERARKVLIEKRDARSGPEAAFLTSIIRGLESGDGPQV
jgi:hypothetical protein